MTLHSREKRVAEEIKEALAIILQNDLKDPRLGEALVTVAAVEVTRDLQNATIHVSVLGDDPKEGADVIAALEHSKGFIKRQLGKAVVLRLMPELFFLLDTTGSYAARINELLHQIETEAPARAPQEPAGTEEDSDQKK